MSDDKGNEHDLLPLKNDYVFKRVFGVESHKRVLVCLLNSILNGRPQIKSIEFDKTEYVKDREDGKSVRLDIAATTSEGVRVRIEMQCKNVGDIIQRANFYDAKTLKESIDEGEDYNDIPSRILIWITDYNATNRKSCVNEVVEMYKDNGVDPIEVASEKMRKFIIELTKLEITPKSYVSDMFSVWMTFIKDPESIPEEFLKIPEVNEAMKELQYVSQDKKASKEYLARQMEINDYNAGITKAKKEGRAEGEKKAKIETARNLLKAGVDVNIIAASVGLSVEEIKQLKRELS